MIDEKRSYLKDSNEPWDVIQLHDVYSGNGVVEFENEIIGGNTLITYQGKIFRHSITSKSLIPFVDSKGKVSVGTKYTSKYYESKVYDADADKFRTLGRWERIKNWFCS